MANINEIYGKHNLSEVLIGDITSISMILLGIFFVICFFITKKISKKSFIINNIIYNIIFDLFYDFIYESFLYVETSIT